MAGFAIEPDAAFVGRLHSLMLALPNGGKVYAPRAELYQAVALVDVGITEWRAVSTLFLTLSHECCTR